MRCLFLLLFCSTAFAGGGEYDVPDKPYECDALIPADLEPVHGWKVVRAEDRLLIGEQVSQGKAKWQKRLTLLCRDVSGGKVSAEFMAYQLWFKVVKK